MSSPDNKVTRRSLLRGALGGAAAVGLAAIPVRVAFAEELSEDDPMAKALAYYKDAGAVPADEYPNYKPDQNCANCIQYKGADGEALGPCALFPGKLVTADGWCKVWVVKP